jgi:26S proteasome regulatory subunit T5
MATLEGLNDDLLMDDVAEDILDDGILSASTSDIITRRKLLENEIRIMRSEFQRLTHDKLTMNEKIKDNKEKIENNK